jgi:hypothetical protein
MILIIGYTTAVSGNLIRYKILVTPFLAILFLMILDIEKAKKFFAKIFQQSRYT